MKRDELLDLITIDTDTQMVFDSSNVCYWTLPDRPHAAVPIKSRKTEGYISGHYTRELKQIEEKERPQALTATQKRNHIEKMEGEAFARNTESTFITIRVKNQGQNYYYNLGPCVYQINEFNVTKLSHNQARDLGILFRVPQKQSDQVEPDLTTPPEYLFNFFKYANVTTQKDQALLLTYMVSLLAPQFTRYMLFLHGQQGAAKSTTLSLIRSMIDPSGMKHGVKDGQLANYNGDRKEIFELTNHHYCMYIDDVLVLSKKEQKDIAKLITDVDADKRQHHTNDDRFYYELQPSLGFTGIDLPIDAPDLLERTLIVPIEKPKKRKRELKMWSEFHSEKPKLFGALLNTFSKALAVETAYSIPSTIRMTEQAEIMACAAEVLGVGGDNLITYLNQNTVEQDNKALEESPAAIMFMEWLREKHENENSFQMPAQKIYDSIVQMIEGSQRNNVNEPLGYNDYKKQYIPVGRESYMFPNNMPAFWRKLKMVQPSLKNNGVTFLKIRKKTRTDYLITHNLKKEEE